MAGLIGVGRQTKEQGIGGLMGAARAEASRNIANSQMRAAQSAQRMSTAGTMGGIGYKVGMKAGMENLKNYAAGAGKEVGQVGFREAFMSQIPGTQASGIAAQGAAGAATQAAPGMAGAAGMTGTGVPTAAVAGEAAAGLAGEAGTGALGTTVGAVTETAAGTTAAAGTGSASTLATLGAAAPWALAAVGVGLLVSKLFD